MRRSTQPIPHFKEQIDPGDIVFTEPFHVEKYQKNDVETLLHYFQNDFIPDLGFSSSLRVTSHTECIRYIRGYVVAHRLKLDKIRDSLADKTLIYEQHSPLTPSPHLVEILFDARSKSSTNFPCLSH